jgi:hypothetical protein
MERLQKKKAGGPRELKLVSPERGPLRLSLEDAAGHELLVLLRTEISDPDQTIRLTLDELPKGARYLVLESGAGRFIQRLPA